MRDAEKDPLVAFRQVNVGGTEQILRHEGMRGVRRFVYLSSVKARGEATTDVPFSASDRLMPLDPYGQSKLEAEQLVQAIGTEIGIETVIIRPPLVYGPGVGGNFVRLLGAVDKGVPLPFGLIENFRSLVSVQNLCDLIGECLANTAASGKRFLVSDNEDVSTPDLIRLIASSMSRPARLVPVPVAVLTVAAKLLGQSGEMSRLIGSLQVDIEETMQTLNWKPPVSLADGIQSTVTWYQEQKASA
jgi:UDP-glucose 4-epimerase